MSSKPVPDSTGASDGFIVPLKDKAWWKEAVVLQIWPHSFCDSNGDGIGDLPGIISKLDYIKDLGIDVVWLSPVYPSPFKDFGYDISFVAHVGVDFKDINPVYGTLEDWDRLRDEGERRGIKIIMDLVGKLASYCTPYSTATLILSLAISILGSSTPSRRVTVDIETFTSGGTNGLAQFPNRTIGNPSSGVSQLVLQKYVSQYDIKTGGPAWTFDETTQQYYLHKYDSSQPDINWECQELREAVHDVVKFWLDRGCAGFRLDAISKISVPHDLPDAPVVNPQSTFQPADMYMVHGPKVQDYLHEMHSKILQREMSATSPAKALEYIHPSRKQLQMIFQFEHMFLDASATERLKRKQWKFPEMKAITAAWQRMQSEQGGWCANYLSNHDQGRPVSRYGNDSPQFRARSAKLLALLETTLPGTLYLYQGEELAVKNFPKDFTIEDLPDIQTQKYWKSKKSGGADMKEVFADLQLKARDNARLPIPWDASQPNAGFTNGTPWMKMDKDDFEVTSAAAQVADPNSVRAFWKRCIAYRKEHDVLTYGIYKDLDPDDEKIHVYTLSSPHKGNPAYLVILNFSDHESSFVVPKDSISLDRASLVISNIQHETSGSKIDAGDRKVVLEGWEARLYAL
ncbi:MAG: hypothetical protein TREMPRED_005071 [Tremellales sp. Tagirdzhanova-0007]|nr:MAG: hypothetical protein TREMPRED_005071 [Tremellales sp. Tagirdzhanova-0007]